MPLAKPAEQPGAGNSGLQARIETLHRRWPTPQQAGHRHGQLLLIVRGRERHLGQDRRVGPPRRSVHRGRRSVVRRWESRWRNCRLHREPPVLQGSRDRMQLLQRCVLAQLAVVRGWRAFPRSQASTGCSARTCSNTRCPSRQLPPHRRGHPENLRMVFGFCISHFDDKTVVRQFPFTALIPQDNDLVFSQPCFHRHRPAAGGWQLKSRVSHGGCRRRERLCMPR